MDDVPIRRPRPRIVTTRAYARMYTTFTTAAEMKRRDDDGLQRVTAQLDLFPVKPVIDVLDPRTIVGARTGVVHLVRVRARANDTPHLVYHDRHGWYCETHGPQCPTVRLAQEQVSL